MNFLANSLSFATSPFLWSGAPNTQSPKLPAWGSGCFPLSFIALLHPPPTWLDHRSCRVSCPFTIFQKYFFFPVLSATVLFRSFLLFTWMFTITCWPVFLPLLSLLLQSWSNSVEITPKQEHGPFLQKILKNCHTLQEQAWLCSNCCLFLFSFSHLSKCLQHLINSHFLFKAQFNGPSSVKLSLAFLA